MERRNKIQRRAIGAFVAGCLAIGLLAWRMYLARRASDEVLISAYQAIGNEIKAGDRGELYMIGAVFPFIDSIDTDSPEGFSSTRVLKEDQMGLLGSVIVKSCSSGSSDWKFRSLRWEYALKYKNHEGLQRVIFFSPSSSVIKRNQLPHLVLSDMENANVVKTLSSMFQ